MSYRDAVRKNQLADIHGETYPSWLDTLVDYGILLLFPLTGLFLCLALIFGSLWVIVWVIVHLRDLLLP